jgi:hypothetical protein
VPDWKTRVLARIAGGYIVDEKKLRNILYRESLLQYFSTLIEYGVPFLYFPDCVGQTDDPGENEFYTAITEALYRYTVEIAMIPAEISYYDKQDPAESSKTLRKSLQNRVHVNFSLPIYLSDYTRQPHQIIGLSGAIRNIWKLDRKVFSHHIMSRLLYENDYRMRLDAAPKMVKEFTHAENLNVSKSPAKIVKKGLQFLTENDIVVVQNGIIIVENQKELWYYADMV